MPKLHVHWYYLLSVEHQPWPGTLMELCMCNSDTFYIIDCWEYL